MVCFYGDIIESDVYVNIPYNIKESTKYMERGKEYSLKGDYKNALENFRKAIAIERMEKGENSFSVAQTYLHIGLSLSNLGEYDKALKEFQKATLTLTFGVDLWGVGEIDKNILNHLTINHFPAPKNNNYFLKL